MISRKRILATEKKLSGIKCPFCGKGFRIIVKDDEGNRKGHVDDDIADQYLDEQWSGISFGVEHDSDGCPIDTGPYEDYAGYATCYYTPEAIIKAFSKRSKQK